MIFIVLGTQKFQLNRLLKLIDQYIDEKIINEEVVAQIGNSTYEPKNYKFERFMDKDTFDKHIAESDIMITHSGVGTIISGLNASKPIIVFPRLKNYGEHVDDHQLDIANAFAKKNYVLACFEDDNLCDLIEKARTQVFEKYVSQRKEIVSVIEKYLNTL